jgi:DNA-binding response OmpR family regulator
LTDRPGDDLVLAARSLASPPMIIVVSADARTERIRELYALGADRYLTKPLSIELLLATMHEAVVRRAQGA